MSTMARYFVSVVCISYCLLFLTVENRSVKRTGTTTTWCCDIEPQNVSQTVTTTELVQKTITNYTEHVHRRPCHLWETPVETVTNYFGFTKKICYDIRNNTFLQTVFEEVPKTSVVVVPGVCPQEHMKCCSGYELLGGQCVASGSKDALQELIDAGLVGR